MNNGFGGMDFAAGSVFGLRAWKLLPDSGRLRGVSARYAWHDGENVAMCRKKKHTADCDKQVYGFNVCTCDSKRYGCGDLIDPACGCGFWAYYADQVHLYGGDVVGVVKGYGRTTLGTRGFRCEKARIISLALPLRERTPGMDSEDPLVRAMASFADAVNCLGARMSPLAVSRALYAEPRDRIIRRYRGAEVYPSVEEMLEAHPVDQPPEGADDDSLTVKFNRGGFTGGAAA